MSDAVTFSKGVRLRRYPFPYKAALAVSNDTDGMDWTAFEEWHAFVSGSGPSAYGDGLGLEIGDSFWIWSDRGAFALRHAPPWADQNRPSPEAGRITELVEAGWLDTLHSFGDWEPQYQLSRLDIVRAFELLDALELRPPVYVNHGGGLRYHNIGGPWAAYQSGDDPDSDFYHLGAALTHGFRFFWTDVMFENDRLGEYMRPAARSDLHSYPLHRWTMVSERNGRAQRGEVRDVLTGIPADRARNVAQHLANSLIIPAIGRDGSPFWGFKRFRGHEGPNAANFALQASTGNLDLLEQGEGACVIYQHFGVWRAIGRPKTHDSQRESATPLLDESAVWAFRDIAERQAAGRLFVTTTGRLLAYLHLRDTLTYSVEATEGGLDIALRGIDCPVSGNGPLPSRDALQGLCFLVPADAGEVRLRIGDSGSLDVRREPDPLNPDYDAVYLPWQRLEFPPCEVVPSRSLTAKRSGWRQPRQDTDIVHRGLTAEQAARMVGMVDSMVERKQQRAGVRGDLETVVRQWDDIKVPAILQGAADYVRKMHAEPFQAYRSRLRRLTSGGKVALDAGSGTATWSFALADLFDEVVAVDKNRSRVDFARWLVERSGCSRIDVSYGDVTDLSVERGAVDLVFCYGVVISGLPLRAVLREFRRVVRRGGTVYLCVNGIGWSRYLRDDRGAQSASAAIQGRRGLYNTLCQSQQGSANERMSKLLALASTDEATAETLGREAGLDARGLTAFLVSARKASSIADLSLPGRETPLATSQELAATLDTILGAAGLQAVPMVETLAAIEADCGEDFVGQFGIDLINLLSGRRDGFSHASAGRGYTPEEVQAICEEVGLVDFRWAHEGDLIGYSGEDRQAPRFFPSEFRGDLAVWEFMARRP